MSSDKKFTVSNGMKYIMANNQSGYYTMNVEVTNVKPNNEYEVKIYSDAYLKRPGTESVVNRFEIPQIVYKNEDSFTVTSVGKLKSSTEAYTAPKVTVTSIDLPPTVAVIDEYAFANYGSLTQVTGAHNLRTIKNSAFAWCCKLESLPDVADLAFVEEIEDYAFYLCDSFHIANLTSIKKLGKGSFSVRSGSNYGLSTLVLGDQLAGSIPEDCFYNNKLLTSVEIPAGVNSIGKNAFSFCSNLKTITIHATIPPTLDTPFLCGSTIYVPFGCNNDCNAIIYNEEPFFAHVEEGDLIVGDSVEDHVLIDASVGIYSEIDLLINENAESQVSQLSDVDIIEFNIDETEIKADRIKFRQLLPSGTLELSGIEYNGVICVGKRNSSINSQK